MDGRYTYQIRSRKSDVSGMNLYHKTVLRRKKANIAEAVEDYSGLVKGMKDKGLIDEDFIAKNIKDEKSPSGQVMLMVDVVLASSRPDAFQILMDLLSEKYNWLVTEIETDVRYEEGIAGVEPDVAKEAGVLVHKKFGTSKRFGEGDKKDMIDLIGVKMQLQNEEWRKKSKVTEDRVGELQKLISEREAVVVQLLKQLKVFTKTHQNRLITHAHGMTTTSQMLFNVFENNKKESLVTLKQSVDLFLTRCDQILRHRDGLMEERGRCLTALGIKDEKNQVDMALKARLTALNSTISKYADSANALQNVQRIDTDSSGMAKEELVAELNKRNATIKQLNKRLTDLEEKSFNKDEVIVQLQQEIAGNKKQIANLDQRIVEVTSELNTLQLAAEELKKKKTVVKKMNGKAPASLKTGKRPSTAVST